jgi:zinc transporter, ZIP family
MGEALFYGALGASSLVVGATLALWLKPSHRVIGLILAFGAGALISAVAFELVQDPLAAGRTLELSIGMGLGALAFFFGNLLIDRSGGSNRRKMQRSEGEGNALALFLGVLLDGIPESFILGMTILTEGEVGWAFLAAVFVSNLPEGMATTSGFRQAGWPVRKINLLWLSVVAMSALSAAIGYKLFDGMSNVTGVYVQGFAAGSLLTMLTDTMMPDAYKEAGKVAGLMTVLGFAVAVAISAVE